jgi:parallel beta-helix repeat protein
VGLRLLPESLINNTATGHKNLFYLDSSSNNTLTGNTATNYYGYCFYLNSSSNNTLTGNTATGGGDCFYLENSSNNTFSGNIAKNTGPGWWAGFTGGKGPAIFLPLYYSGFYLINSSYNTFINNTIENYWGCGFYKNSYSINNTFENNTVIATGSLLENLLYVMFDVFSFSSNSQNNTLVNGLRGIIFLSPIFICIVCVVIVVKVSRSIGSRGKNSGMPKASKKRRPEPKPENGSNHPSGASQ